MDSFDDIFKTIDGIGKKEKSCVERWSDVQIQYSPKIKSMLEMCQEDISIIETGDLLIAIPQKRWGMEQLLAVIGDQIGPIDLWCCVYAVSGDSMSRLRTARDKGFLRNIRFVIDERTKTWKPQNYSLITNLCEEENVGVIKTHAKIFVCKQVDGNKIISIIGSANFTKTPGTESMVIMTDPSIGMHLIEILDGWINNAKNT
jgi:hypothetical protein